MKHIPLVLIVALATPGVAEAQSFRQKLVGFGEKIVAVFSAPVHPIVKSVGPEGGFGPGIVYKPKLRTNEPWSFRTEALVTPRRYWNTEVSFQYTTASIHFETYGRARELTRLDFYGAGPHTGLESRSSFRYLDRTFGGLVSVPLQLSRTGIRFGGRLEGIHPEVDHGRNPEVPSIEERFGDLDAPGLSAQPNFVASSGFVVLQYPDDLNQLAQLGVDMRTSYTFFRGGAELDFGRLTLESQQRLPGFRASDRLTLHELYSAADARPGSRVPFYLQQTLGGVGDVRTFNDQILGSDATKATLRGFRDLRFRDSHLVLLQAEYRLKLWGPIDGTVFIDAGTVAARREELALRNFARSYGFSVSLMTVDATAVRLDVGFGGKEGTHVFFSIGPIFQQ
jgi:outer membrane protein assembly factor BamA